MTSQKRFRSAIAGLFLLTAIGISFLWQTNTAAAFFTTNYSSYAKVTTDDGLAGDRFGSAVAVSADGNTIVVGAEADDLGVTQDQGSAYVYTRQAGTIVIQQQLFANGGNVQRFGTSVAINDDTIAVGSPGDDGNAGALYIFTRINGNWTQTQRLIASDGAANDYFGQSVSLNGNSLVVGAYGDANNRGSAYVFVRAGLSWSQQSKLIPGDGTGDDLFGLGVAISGDTVAVGASAANVGGIPGRGSVYIFARNGNIWLLQQKLFAADGVSGDNFGRSVALDGNTVLIGAWLDSSFLHSNHGSAYIFTRTGMTWSMQDKLIGSDFANNDLFGNAVALNGDTAIIGAIGKKVGAVDLKGEIYVFTRTGAAWSEQQNFTTSNNTGSLFGHAVAFAGDTIAVGAPRESSHKGAAYIYRPLNHAPTLNLAGTLNHLAGDGIKTNINIATIADQDQAADTLQFTINGAASATSNGVTVNSVNIGANGVVSATPQISCSAADAHFTLRVTDNEGDFVQALLVVNIGANTAPTLAYGTQNLNVGGFVDVLPLAVPYDNGNIVSLQSAGITPSDFQGTFTILNPLNGAIRIFSSGQVGSYTATVRATDNCGLIRNATFTFNIINGGGGATGLQFYPLAHPVRLLDTRAGAPGCDAPGAMIPGGTSRTQTAAGRTCDGLSIPANAKALTGNITTVQSGGGYLTLYPSDAAQPNVANSNYTPNQILNNVFTVGLGANDGAFKIFVTTNTNVVVDVTGYYAPPAAGGLYFHPLPKPIRLLETRQGQPGCQATNSQLQSNSVRTQLGITTCDNVTIPAGAQALVGNATTVGPQTGGWLTFYPADAAQPLVASSNFLAGDVMNAPFTVGLSPSGEFKVFTTSTTDLVVDVVGYYSTQMNDTNGQGLLFNSLPAPVRLLDTRAGFAGCFTPGAKMTGGTTYTQAATGACMNIPATAKAVVGSAAVVFPVGGGWLTFGPSSAPLPFVAASNYQAGQIFNRHFIVGLGADGAFKRYSFATTDLVIDLSGYFAP